jgi:hypothetical protein
MRAMSECRILKNTAKVIIHDTNVGNPTIFMYIQTLVSGVRYVSKNNILSEVYAPLLEK